MEASLDYPGGDAIRSVTFHSHSGGTGRSMALAGVAVRLAHRHGKRVLAVDWNMAAPGLHRSFGLSDASLAAQSGLLEYLADCKEEYRRIGGPEEPLPEVVDVGRYVSVVPLGEHASAAGRGRIDLLAGGRLDPSYFQRVDALDWDAWYKGGGYWIIERLRRQAMDAYDLLLIDAPSGRAPSAVAPLVQLPDLVVFLFGPDARSLSGAGAIASEVARHPLRVSSGRKPIRVVLSPSRVPIRDPRFDAWMDGEVAREFGRLMRDGVVDRRLQPEGARQFVLGLDDGVPLGAAPAVDAAETDATPLARAYSDLSTLIVRLSTIVNWYGATPLSVSRNGRYLDEASAAIAEAEDRNDLNTASMLRLEVARNSLAAGTSEADSKFLDRLILASIYFETNGTSRQHALCLLLEARARMLLNEFEVAEDRLERAIAIVRNDGDRLGEGVVRREFGRLMRMLGALDASLSAFREGLVLADQAGDLVGMADALQCIAEVDLAIGEYAEGRRILASRIALADRVADSVGMAQGFALLVEFFLRQGDTTGASGAFSRALLLYRQAGDAVGETQLLARFGTL